MTGGRFRFLLIRPTGRGVVSHRRCDVIASRLTLGLVTQAVVSKGLGGQPIKASVESGAGAYDFNA